MEISFGRLNFNNIKEKAVSFAKSVDKAEDKQFVRQYTGEDTFVSAVSYFPFASAAILLLRKNNSEFVLFHARQSVVILVISIFLLLILPGPAKVIWAITAYTFLVYGAYRALQGRKWYLPVVTELANTINI